ncbi:MAG: ferredoxin--NADP(+) reductase [Cyanobacteria bacterium]|nr:ferredoxin--NADP(+) reductase [Cyanobacteriota bacterium]
MTTPQASSPATGHPGLDEIPSNLYKLAEPLQARIIEHRRLTAADSPNEVSHIVIDIKGSRLRYLDGQSIGVLPPGQDENGKPHKLRLYSIASPSYGDDGKGETVTICVKRAVSEGFPPGVCSSFLCNSNVGDTVSITGPVGKSFLLPSTPNANVIMIGTGTGIAPFRAFLKTRYEKRPQETGQFWVFFGAQTRKDFLYEEEYPAYQQHPTFNLVTAFSREEKNAEGGRMYVQHRLQEKADTLFSLLQDPNTYLFICGLKGMEPGIMEGLTAAAAKQGIDWNAFFEKLKAEKRWHVEVY